MPAELTLKYFLAVSEPGVSVNPVNVFVSVLGLLTNSSALPEELTATNLLAVNEPGVSDNPVNVELPPPLPREVQVEPSNFVLI